MAFHYLDTAIEGGDTLLTSSWQVYNDLAKTRPDVLNTLTQPWWFDSFKAYDAHPPRHIVPLQKVDDDKIHLRLSRYRVIGWQRKRNPNLPAPTQAQLEALDAVQFTAMKNAITLRAVRGDLLFVNDMVLMHAREKFDEGGIFMKRHLVKLYLRDPEKDWHIPPSLEEERRETYGSNRPDGLKKEVWHVIYVPGIEEHKRENG